MTRDSLKPSAKAISRTLQDKSVRRSSVKRILSFSTDAEGCTLVSVADDIIYPRLSSANLPEGNHKRTEGGSERILGIIRVDVVSEVILRVRYHEGATLPQEDTRLIGVRLPLTPSFQSEKWTHGLVLRTSRAVLKIDFRNGAMSLADSAENIITEIGGPETNNFKPWDSYNTGLCRSVLGLGSIAVESFKLRPGEGIYGFGEKFGPLNKVGQTVELEMEDALGVTSFRSYKNVPFFLSTSGYGVFFNHYCLASFFIGSLSVTDIQVGLLDEHLDYFLFVGSIKQVLNDYTSLTGKSHVPPKWSFGLWQSKCTYSSASEALEIARRMRLSQIPCDVIHIDTGWFRANWYCDLEWDKERFPSPRSWIKEMADMGFKVSLWQLPYLPEGSRLFSEIADVGGFVKDKSGEIFDCKIGFVEGFEGTVGVIDFTHPEAVEIYTKYLKRLLSEGVKAIKTDFGEEAPIDGIYFDGTPGEKMHNLYPLLYNKIVSDIMQEVDGGALVWARSAWAGSQRYPIHWGGDSSPYWSNLIPQISGGLSLGLSGFTYWSHDIGGFMGEMTDEHLLIRWLQAGIFCSHVRIHGMGGPQELYSFSPETLNISREFINLRYRLLPYILSEAKICSEQGQPIMRALVLDFQQDPNVRGIEDQFLFGRSMMVAPIYDPTNMRNVYFPSGRWFDWWTGEFVDGPAWQPLECSLDRIPIFVREGSCVPIGPTVDHIGDGGLEVCEVLLAPSADDGIKDMDLLINGRLVKNLYRRIGEDHFWDSEDSDIPIRRIDGGHLLKGRIAPFRPTPSCDCQ